MRPFARSEARLVSNSRRLSDVPFSSLSFLSPVHDAVTPRGSASRDESAVSTAPLNAARIDASSGAYGHAQISLYWRALLRRNVRVRQAPPCELTGLA